MNGHASRFKKDCLDSSRQQFLPINISRTLSNHVDMHQSQELLVFGNTTNVLLDSASAFMILVLNIGRNLMQIISAIQLEQILDMQQTKKARTIVDLPSPGTISLVMQMHLCLNMHQKHFINLIINKKHICSILHISILQSHMEEKVNKLVPTATHKELPKNKIKCMQSITGTFLHCTRAIDFTMLTALNDIGTT